MLRLSSSQFDPKTTIDNRNFLRCDISLFHSRPRRPDRGSSAFAIVSSQYNFQMLPSGHRGRKNVPRRETRSVATQRRYKLISKIPTNEGAVL